MSLKQVATELADRLRELVKDARASGRWLDTDAVAEVAAELSGAARAAPDAALAPQHVTKEGGVLLQRPDAPLQPPGAFVYTPDPYTRAAIARQQALEARRQEHAREAHEARMMCCDGGPADGTYVPVPGDVPEGARTAVEGTTYQVSKGRLIPVD